MIVGSGKASFVTTLCTAGGYLSGPLNNDIHRNAGVHAIFSNSIVSHFQLIQTPSVWIGDFLLYNSECKPKNKQQEWPGNEGNTHHHNCTHQS